MGNRAALILSSGATPAQGVPDLAYGTNNYTAPFWYAALSEADLEGWEACWQKLTAEEPAPEDYDAATLWLPWPDAEARLVAAATRAEAEAPPWGARFIAWQNALRALATEKKARWLGLELTEIFAFHEEPATMVAEARDGLRAFHGAAPMRLEMPDNPEHLGGYPDSPALRGVEAPPRPVAPPQRHWCELKHLPASLLIIIGIWIITTSVLATLAAALVILGGLGLLVMKGPRGA
ncbi:hypothetical protein BKE38_18850 [Pseudoroseomonas deserti]|uniref:Uncharacterized protein n=1 Tax=Teichococcus deserti TaxID=1817963 RepID=A0A1V2GZW9_9PROT|nr:hypothetical protein [Pseudoroseomonas deserti]ONG50241.1 hypothetical protein BKE38_18850 [Pseudoroseomonas deserti]